MQVCRVSVGLIMRAKQPGASGEFDVLGTPHASIATGRIAVLGALDITGKFDASGASNVSIAVSEFDESWTE